ncbi:MAG: hypothetical protein M0Z88_02695 [Actinomycetota bacterium]|nr:hypothetical protein [Actinomycetota bacterium]
MNLIGLPATLATLARATLLEVVAAMTVESLSDGVVLRRLDPGGGSDQLADFQFVDCNGIDRGRLEITTTTRENRSGFGREVAKLDWQFPTLEWSWTIKAQDTARIKVLHRKIDPFLAQLEREGRTDGWIPDKPGLDPADPDALPAGLSDLGVLSVCAYHHHAAGEPSWVTVSSHIRGGSYSLNAVVWEAQAEVDKADNRRKLQVADVGRSELFVWLDVGDGQAALSTLAEPPFDQALRQLPVVVLPAGVTAVWAASGLATWPRPVSVLLLGDERGWRAVVPPALDYDDDQVEALLVRLEPSGTRP